MNKELLIKALNNIKNLLAHLDGNFLSPEVIKWFRNWDCETIEETENEKIEVIGTTIIIKNSNPKKSKKKRSRNIAVKIDNLLIVIKNNIKGKQGFTYYPKRDGDRVVILIDNKDVKDEIAMKIVLFHELVHVKQIRDKNSGFKDIRDSLKENGKPKTDKEIDDELNAKLSDYFETEAHLASMFFTALLVQAHPENIDIIIKKYKESKKLFNRYRKKVPDKKLFNLIIQIIEKLIPDIQIENAKLIEEVELLNTWKTKLETQLTRYKNSLPETKESTKIKERLNKIEEKINETLTKISAFEESKQAMLEKEALLRESLKNFKCNSDEIKEEKGKLKELKKSFSEFMKELKRLNRKLKKLCETIKDNTKELASEVLQNEDDTLIEIFSFLMREFQKSSIILKKIKFKFSLLEVLEEILSLHD